VERDPSFISRVIQFPAGGPAQLLHGLFGLFGKFRRLFRYRFQSSQDVPPKLGMVCVCMFGGKDGARLPPFA
jgi:hypothetical protein